MHMRSDGDYYWADNYSAAYRYLASGGRMWFILPDEGVSVDALLEDEDVTRLMSAGEADGASMPGSISPCRSST